MNFDEYLTEGVLDTWLNKQKGSIINNLKKVFKELIETKESGQILYKLIKRQKVTKEEKEALKEQSVDLLKGIGLGSTFILPGGGLLIALLIYVVAGLYLTLIKYVEFISSNLKFNVSAKILFPLESNLYQTLEFDPGTAVSSTFL